MKQKSPLVALGLLALLVVSWLTYRGCSKVREPQPPPTVAVPVPSPTPKPKKSQPVKKPPVVSPAPKLAPPPVQIFKELIPKNIEIVRVYYANMITGPDSSIEFDINGSGFNKEFEKMIKVESGQKDTAVKNLALVTPNQIHGTLVISPQSATTVAFPQVLIGEKTVFQAPEPFAVIRPGEVLNLVFTEMGESGRSGRFRVFTNLTEEMFKNFEVSVTTSTIQVMDLSPTFPFVVDGIVIIGPAVGGEYGIDVTLKDKNIWHKDGIIRVVKPNVGQSGLIQRVQVQDEFRRPGDKVLFAVQGSGFQPQDTGILKASVDGLELVGSSFTYLAPGRMELTLVLPSTALEKTYGLTLSAGDAVLQELPKAFRVVEKNWTRGLALDPELTPGGKSTVILQGRDLSADFVNGLKVELDEAELTIGSFTLANPDQAVAPISAGAQVKPGDYLLHMSFKDTPVNPQFGSIIRVSPPK